MNTLEQQIKDTLIADRKFALEKLEQLKNPENYGLTVFESPQYYSDWLEQIEDKLARLDDGEYNVCRSCLGSIGADRLLSKPWANLCVTCQQKLDIQEKADVQKKATVHRLIRAFGGVCN